MYPLRLLDRSQFETLVGMAEAIEGVDRAYRLADHAWGIFSLDRLARTPEFRQAAA